MPHIHQTTEIYTRRIEDTIEQLLQRGELISRALNREIEIVRRPSQLHIPCSRSTSSRTHYQSTVLPISTFQPTQKATRTTEEIEKKSRLPCERISSQVTVATTTKKRIIDPETNVEMYSYPVVPGAKSRCQHSEQKTEDSTGRQEFVQEVSGPKKTTKRSVSHSFSRHEVAAKSKEERENWKKIFTHEGGDLLKGHGSLEEVRVTTTVYEATEPGNEWIRVNTQWVQVATGRIVLNLWADVLGEESKNVWVNGKIMKM